jgi:hypothetical protein
MRGVQWDRNPEYRERQHWPSGMAFENVQGEKIIERAMPPRPVTGAIGCSGAVCVGARFAEGEIDGRLM